MEHRDGYSAVQIGLHWLTAVLILGAFLLSEEMDDALRERIQSGATGTEGNTLHVWLGGAALLVVLVRIVARRLHGAPEAPAGTPPSWEKAATWGHRLLYALMVLVPLGGALTWYGGLNLGAVHEIAGKALMLTVGGHVVAAMLHEALRGDGTMARMFRPRD